MRPVLRRFGNGGYLPNTKEAELIQAQVNDAVTQLASVRAKLKELGTAAAVTAPNPAAAVPPSAGQPATPGAKPGAAAPANPAASPRAAAPATPAAPAPSGTKPAPAAPAAGHAHGATGKAP